MARSKGGAWEIDMVSYTLYEFFFFLFLYAFLGWLVDVAYYSIRDKRFVNHGLVSLPFNLPCGIIFAILINLLPRIGRNIPLQFLAALAVTAVVDSVTGFFSSMVSRIPLWGQEGALSASWRKALSLAVRAAAEALVFNIVHPVLLTLSSLLPDLLIDIAVWACAVLIAADFAATVFATRFRKKEDAAPAPERRSEKWTQGLANRITAHIWKRLEKNYPGIESEGGEAKDGRPVFAKGMCLDKLIWVFLISALLGDVIETLFCGLVNHSWMNRSSVLYGPFSFVWGIGATFLTVTLHKLADKEDRYAFLGGFVIGGAYEYLCSVFTEIVFGTVFWDYSDMPLNIGGRTNVLFCFFWGVLAVFWIKIALPPIERVIERIPPLAGKIATWVAVFLMACNALLTASAMQRYTERAVSPEPAGILDEFLDSTYDDEYMERRWPNMKRAEDVGNKNKVAGTVLLDRIMAEI